MAITNVLITGKVVIPGTTIGVRAKITATPLTTNHALTWPAENTTSWGPATVETGNDGVIPAPGLAIPLGATVAGDLLWRFVAKPIDRKDLKAWDLGTFPITVATDLADLVSIETVVYTPAQVATFAALLAAAQTNATAAAASATAADGWADAAASSAADADSSADLAALSETAAETAATTATTQAGTASTSAGTASTAATTATGAASSATASAATATTKASEASTSATAAQGHAASAAGSVSLVAWAPSVAYVTGDVRQAPDGSTVRRNANGTSGASFDATERATWTAVGAVAGTMEQEALSATIAGRAVPHPGADLVNIGDSLAARDMVVTSPGSYSYAPQLGAFQHAAVTTGQRCYLRASYAVSGKRADEVLTEQVPTVVALDPTPTGVLVQVGTNDINQDVRTSAQIITSLDGILDALLATGTKVIIGTIPPSVDYDTDQRTRLYEVNRWIKDQGRARTNVHPVDWFSRLADENGDQRTALFADTLHQNQAGAAAMGATLAPVLSNLFPPVDVLPEPGDPADVLANPFQIGTTGTLVSGAGSVTGQAATGWYLATADGTALTAVASKVARTDGLPGEWQQIAVTTGSFRYIQDAYIIAAHGWAVGDELVGYVEFETDPGAAASRFHAYWQVEGGAIVGALLPHPGDVSDAEFTLPESGVLETPAFPIPVGAVNILFYIRAFGADGSTIRVGRCGLRNLNA